MKKIVLSIMLCVMVLLNSFTIAHASSERMQVTPDFSEEDYLESRIDNTVFEWGNPTPFYEHISMASYGFGIFGNEAECNLSITGYSNVNKISAYIYVQRYSSGKWATITGGNFRKEVNSSDLSYTPTKILDTKGTYRFSVQAFVYTKEGSVELIEAVSNTAVY